MALTRIKNNQHTDADPTQSDSSLYYPVAANVGGANLSLQTRSLDGIYGLTKIVNYSITGDKWANSITAVTDLRLNRVTTGSGDIGGNLVIEGNLTVLGNVTSVEATTTRISDSIIQLGYGNDTNGIDANADIGFIFTLPADNGAFLYDQTAEEWQLGYTSDDAYAANLAVTFTRYGNLRVEQLRANLFATGNLVFANNTISTDGTANGTNIQIRPNSDTGNVYFLSGGSIVSNTDVRIASGTIGDLASLTIDEGNLTVANGNASVTGNSIVTGNSYVTGTFTQTGGEFNANATLANIFIANGNVTLETGNFALTNANFDSNGANFEATATQGNISFINGNISIDNGSLTLANGNANVTGTVTIEGDLVQANGNVTMDATVGNLTFASSNVALGSNSSLTMTSGNVTLTSAIVDVTGDMIVRGNFTQNTGTFSTNTTVGNLYFQQGGVTLANGNLSVTGTTTLEGAFTQANGNVTITSPLANISLLNSNISLGNSIITATQGNIEYANGNIVLANGDIYATNIHATLGNFSTNVRAGVNFIANSGLELTSGNAFTIFNLTGVDFLDGNSWVGNSHVTSNLYVEGTAKIRNLEIASDLFIPGNLTVNGNTVYLNVETLTSEDPIVRFNANTDANGNATVAGGVDVGVQFSYMNGGNIANAFMGILDSDYSTYVFYDSAEINGAQVANGALASISVKNITTSGLNADGSPANSSIGANLSVTSNVSAGGNLTVGEATTIGSNLTVTTWANIGTEANIGGNLTVEGWANVASDANIGGNIIGNGWANIATEITVGTDANIGGNVLVGGWANIAGDANIGANILGNGWANIAGDIVGGGEGSILGNVTIGNVNTPSFAMIWGNLTAEGNTTIGNTAAGTGYTEYLANIISTSTNTGTVVITGVGGLGVGGNINGGGDLSSGGNLTVTGWANIGGDANIGANIIGNGWANIAGDIVAGGEGSILGNVTIGNVNTPSFAMIWGNLTAEGNVAIGNAAAGTGYTEFLANIPSSSSNTGTVVITGVGGLGVGGNLNVDGLTNNIGNIQIYGDVITNKVDDASIFINPNANGNIIINDTLSTGQIRIGAGTANTFVIQGNAAAVTSSNADAFAFIDNVTFAINAIDSMLLPVGNIAVRPIADGETDANLRSQYTGAFRFNPENPAEDNGTIEWWDGSSWRNPQPDFTMIVSQNYLGSDVDQATGNITLPNTFVNASSIGCILTINGLIQMPGEAYGVVTGAVDANTGVVTTPAVLNFPDLQDLPGAEEVINIRMFTTTRQVNTSTLSGGSVTIATGANLDVTGSMIPTANVTYNLGSSSFRWNELFLAGSTISLGAVKLKDNNGEFTVEDASGNAVPQKITSITKAGTTGVGDIGSSSSAFGNIYGTGLVQAGSITKAGTTGVGDIGSSSSAFGNAYLTGAVQLASITKTGTTGTGNIGQTNNRFNTIFGLSTSAQYADLAECYSSDAEYEPGTVVMFGGDAEVTICSENMTQRVAGVVSTNPAYLMNDGLQGTRVAVALQGRVPTRVLGSVKKGDMMVSAGNGRARAEAYPVIGSVIGKALEDFSGVEGVIEVVIGRV